jgi:hypothetical protein
MALLHDLNGSRHGTQSGTSIDSLASHPVVKSQGSFELFWVNLRRVRVAGITMESTWILVAFFAKGERSRLQGQPAH